MTTGIYAIMSHDKTVCLYVGQSRDVETRWKQHEKRLKAGTALSDFSKWYASQDDTSKGLEFILLEETLADDLILNQAEIFWFRLLRPAFYGKVPSQKDVWVHSEETKQKISVSLMKADALINRVLACPQCGQDFSSIRRQAKFCSRECGKKFYDKTDVKRIKSLRQQGKSLREIAKIVGVSHITVRKKLRSSATSGTI